MLLAMARLTASRSAWSAAAELGSVKMSMGVPSASSQILSVSLKPTSEASSFSARTSLMAAASSFSRRDG